MKQVLTLHTILKFLVGHILAGTVVISGTFLAGLIFWVLQLAHGIEGEPFLLMTVAGLVAIIAWAGSFLLSLLLTRLRCSLNFPAWLPIVVIPLLAFLWLSLIYAKTKGMVFVAVITGGVFIYFGIYWIILISSSALVEFLRCLLKRGTQ